mmetsp:Transcript_26324/g.57063  ORF Transcript_26324/g.57063 Transcript_26324/m.57063 type:complete len:141 (-) Transcript_26324:91-513(-)
MGGNLSKSKKTESNMKKSDRVVYLWGECLTPDGTCGDVDSTKPKWQLVKDRIEGSKVIVFSKSYCPYCRKVKTLLDEEGVPYTVLELDTHEDGASLQRILYQITGQRTVPNVFVKGGHVGGASDTIEAYRSGELAKLLEG